MNSNMKVIKLTGILTIVFLFLTYAVSVNNKLQIIDPSFPCLSGEFLLSVFGGLFASTLVVLICEIQKYLENKQNAQMYLFTQGYYLYGQLLIIKDTLQRAQINNNLRVPSSIARPTSLAQTQVDALYFTQYETFNKEDSLTGIHQKFRTESYQRIVSFLQQCAYLEIAVNTDKLNKLENELHSTIAEESSHAQIVIERLLYEIQPVLSDVDNYLTQLDQSCNGRFGWDSLKKSVSSSVKNVDYDAYNHFITQQKQ